MANTIKLKTSAIQGKSPLVSDLQISEFAWNSFDGKLYGKKNDGTASIVEIGGGSGVSDYNDLTNKPDLSVYALQTAVDGIDTRVQALEDNAFITRELPSGSINGTNAIFTLANTPISGSEQVFLNGVLQESGASNDYTISGSTITFNTAPEAGWKLHVNYATGTYSVAPAGSSGGTIYSELIPDVNTPTGSSVDIRVITHNLNSTEVGVRVRMPFFYDESADTLATFTEASTKFAVLPTWNWGDRGVIYQVEDANNIKVILRHIGYGAPWKVVVDVYPLASSGGGSSFTPFRWTATEQVYPLELSDDNTTLYARLVNMGTILSSGELEKPLADIDANLTADKVHRIEAYARVAGRMMPISFGYRVAQYNISWQIYDGKIKVETGDGTWNSLGCQAIIKIIYKK